MPVDPDTPRPNTTTYVLALGIRTDDNNPRPLRMNAAGALLVDSSGGATATLDDLLTELTLIKTNTNGLVITADSIDLSNTTIQTNTDDLESLSRDQALLIGALGADTGASTYNETLNVGASNPGDNTTLLTFASGALSNYESVIKVGNILRLGSAPTTGDFEVLSVDGNLVIIDAQFTFIPTAGVVMDILNNVDPLSLLGRVLTIQSDTDRLSDAVDTIGLPSAATTVVMAGVLDDIGDASQMFLDPSGNLLVGLGDNSGLPAAAVPAQGVMIAVRDGSGNLQFLDKSAIGLEVDVLSEPTHTDPAAGAFPVILHGVTGTKLGEEAAPLITQPPTPEDDFGAVTAPNGSTAPLVGVSTPVTAFALVQNNGAVDLFVGPVGVTNLTGIKIVPGSAIDYPTRDLADVSVWGDGATVDVRFAGF